MEKFERLFQLQAILSRCTAIPLENLMARLDGLPEDIRRQLELAGSPYK